MKLSALIFILCFFLKLNAQNEVIAINESLDRLDVTRDVFAVDPSKEVLSLEQFLEYRNSKPLEKHLKSNIHSPLGDIPAWYTFRVKNAGSTKLDVRGEINNFYIQNIEAFIGINDNYQIFNLGIDKGFYGKTIPHRYGIFEFSLPADKEIEVIIRTCGKFQNAGSKIVLYDKAIHIERIKFLSTLHSAIWGVLLFVTIIALLTFLVTKEHVFFLYFLYAFFMWMLISSITKITCQNLYPNWSLFSSMETMFASIASALVLMLIVASFFSKVRLSTIIQRRKQWIISAIVFVLVFKLLQPWLYVHTVSSGVIAPMILFSMIMLIASLIMVIDAIRQSLDLEGLIFFIIVLIYVLISVLSALINQDIIASGFDVPSFTVIAVLIEVMLMTFLFARRLFIRNNERESLALEVEKLKFEEEKASELERIDEMKNHFLANISHEFRTPLTLIKGAANRMNVQRDKQLILEQSDRILDLINQLLELSQLRSEGYQLKKVQQDVIPLVKNMYRNYYSWAESKDVEIDIQDEAKTCVMDYNEDALRKIVGNLVSNAIKYTDPGGKIALVMAKEDNTLVLTFMDDGIGIAESDIENIRNRFYRSTNGSAQSGFGLGLNIVEEFVHILDGTLEIHSDLAKGSSFIVRLPITNRADIIQEANIKHLSENDVKGADIFREKHRVLIIEDSTEISDYLHSLLRQNFHCLHASNGRQGVEIAEREVPDIILTDLMMPEMNGYQVIEHIKQLSVTSHIPVVLLTAVAGPETKKKALQREADGILFKPFDEDDLLLTLSNLLKLRERIQAALANNTNDDNLEIELSPEQRFLGIVDAHIKEELDNPEFNVDILSSKMYLSRSQLYRKIKAITNKSTVEYIRQIRINEAKSHLLQSDHKISSIAYDLGFKDPAYFSRIFKSEVGLSPQEYREQQ